MASGCDEFAGPNGGPSSSAGVSGQEPAHTVLAVPYTVLEPGVSTGSRGPATLASAGLECVESVEGRTRTAANTGTSTSTNLYDTR